VTLVRRVALVFAPWLVVAAREPAIARPLGPRRSVPVPDATEHARVVHAEPEPAPEPASDNLSLAQIEPDRCNLVRESVGDPIGAGRGR
jgi:hypothetical protein